MEMQKLEMVGWRLKWYVDFTEENLESLHSFMEPLRTERSGKQS